VKVNTHTSLFKRSLENIFEKNNNVIKVTIVVFKKKNAALKSESSPERMHEF